MNKKTGIITAIVLGAALVGGIVVKKVVDAAKAKNDQASNEDTTYIELDSEEFSTNDVNSDEE